jgi:hypothetical protein
VAGAHPTRLRRKQAITPEDEAPFGRQVVEFEGAPEEGSRAGSTCVRRAPQAATRRMGPISADR